jgi:hypothetical protein
MSDTPYVDEHGPRARGLRDEVPPRLTAAGLATGLGAVWGLLGYAILWEGVPVGVDRPFVQSLGGTLALLPVRAVLWGIRRAEVFAGRTFDLSGNHWWIAPTAGAVGAGILVGATVLARAIVRRLRTPAVDRGR